ncbi:MAG: hypothetical protein JSV51_10145 [Candidatus Bathyarchaeota archaeon]|nr:MAG: hypothetical protein JSV51_10145 [Candidatus Bathyarchaeota archaeon]
MKNFIANMSKEDKQRMMKQFMNSMTEEEKAEMMQLMMPIMMEAINPSIMMTSMVKNFNEDDCKKMMKEMPSETREKCKKMMAICLKNLQEIEETAKP